MIPFNIRQKQETRHGQTKVSYIAYVEINVFNHQYRLLKKQGIKHKYTIDGITGQNYFQDKLNGVKVFVSGPNLVFSTTFGLTVSWNGDHKVDVVLCDTYANYVCGLCGNADGKLYTLFYSKNIIFIFRGSHK